MDQTEVPGVLKSVCRGQAYMALRHLVEAGESSVEAIHLSAGGSVAALQVLMVDLYRQGLVDRRKADGGEGWQRRGKKPYLYTARKPLHRWMLLTEQLLGQLRGGAR